MEKEEEDKGKRLKVFYWNPLVPVLRLLCDYKTLKTEIDISPDFKIEFPEVDEEMKKMGFTKLIVVKNPNPMPEFPKDAKCLDDATGQIRCDQDLLICYGKQIFVTSTYINF
jgi:hypothetical protein